MIINWHPGHMAKAMRMMADQVKLVDSVVYVLDARAPAASLNAEFDRLAAGKSVIYVLNKADMVRPQDLERWLKYFKEKQLFCVASESTASKSRTKVVEMLKKANAPMLARYRAKGVKKNIRAMVLGVPNSGKSTLINCLVGGKKTVTGNKPGVTRGKQWVALSDGIELLDTPGTLPPNLQNQAFALHLAMIGSIREEILDSAELSREIVRFYRENDAQAFAERYRLAEMDEDDEILMRAVAVKRGFLLKGGEPDLERAAGAVIEDFKKQRIAKTMLEFPEDIDAAAEEAKTND